MIYVRISIDGGRLAIADGDMPEVPAAGDVLGINGKRLTVLKREWSIHTSRAHSVGGSTDIERSSCLLLVREEA